MGEYIVLREDLEKKTRGPGISAYIRYYNDRHTLLACLESIRGIFDEIVIIHQPCDDYSENLLARIRQGEIPSLANEKFKIISYPWFVYPPHYPAGWRAPRQLHTLANYCNYGLMHIETERFFKIDADQIYFNGRLKEMLERGIREGVDYFPFGINLFLDEDGGPMGDPAKPFNGRDFDHEMMSFSRRPFFIHTRPYEILTADGKRGPRFPKPLWVHLTQIRRPHRLPAGLRHLEEMVEHPSIIETVSNPEFPPVLAMARSAIQSSATNSITFQWVDEFMVVGTGPVDRSNPFGQMIDDHPFVIRFGDGGSAGRIGEEAPFTGKKTDLHCLEGWRPHRADFVRGARVMFTRPLADGAPLGNGLFITEERRDEIASLTENICHIPRKVFQDFFRDYAYDDPSGELIFIYYVKRTLGKKVRIVNFGGGLDAGLLHSRATPLQKSRRLLEEDILASILSGSIFAVELREGESYLKEAATPASGLACRICAPAESQTSIVVEGIWEKLKMESAKELAGDCWRALEAGGRLTIITPDLGLIQRLVDEGDEEIQALIREYMDRHLPHAPFYAAAPMINHWLRRASFFCDRRLLEEILSLAGFRYLERRPAALGLINITGSK